MTPECERVRDQLPEYAAGALEADEYDAVETHLRGCVDCRAEADAYLRVSDAVVTLAPSREPPVGLEATVMDAIDRDAVLPRRRSPRRAVALAAAAGLLLVGGVVLGRTTAHNPAPVVEAVALRSDAQYVGSAFVHRGDPGWVFVEMNYDEVAEPVRLELVGRDGHVTMAGALTERGGRGSLGLLTPLPVGELHEIRMRDATGRIVCHAELRA